MRTDIRALDGAAVREELERRAAGGAEYRAAVSLVKTCPGRYQLRRRGLKWWLLELRKVHKPMRGLEAQWVPFKG